MEIDRVELRRRNPVRSRHVDVTDAVFGERATGVISVIAGIALGEARAFQRVLSAASPFCTTGPHRRRHDLDQTVGPTELRATTPESHDQPLSS
jgi:hypothetical protein